MPVISRCYHPYMADSRRILVLATETVAGRAILDEVRYRGGPEAQVRIVSPVLVPSRLSHFLGTSRDKALDQARERLDASVAAMRAAGLHAEGRLSDADPVQALDDGIRVFQPDEVIISTHPPARSTWLEKKVVATARAEYSIPIHHVVVDLVHEADSVDRDTTKPGPRVPRQKLTLYRASEYEEAVNVHSGGFENENASGRSGVAFTTGEPDTVDEAIVFMVEIPEDLAEPYEVTTDGPDRVFIIPADLVNRHIPRAVSGDFSE